MCRPPRLTFLVLVLTWLLPVPCTPHPRGRFMPASLCRLLQPDPSSCSPEPIATPARTPRPHRAPHGPRASVTLVTPSSSLFRVCQTLKTMCSERARRPWLFHLSLCPQAWHRAWSLVGAQEAFAGWLAGWGSE